MKSRIIKKAYIMFFLLSYIFYNTEVSIPQFMQTTFTVICLLLFLVWGTFERKYRIKELFVYGLTLSIGLASYAITGMSVFLLILLSIIMIDYDDLKETVRIAFILRVIGLLVLLFLCLFDVTSITKGEVYKSGIYITTYTMGFNHSNQLGQVLGIIIIMFIILYNKKIKGLANLFIFCSIIVAYRICGSRTMLGCTMLFFLLTVFMKSNKRRKSLCNIISRYRWLIMTFILFIAVVCPVLMTKLSEKPLMMLYALNAILGSRFSFASAVINNYDLNLFGNVFDFSYLSHLYGTYAVDNGYINILYNFGIIAFACFVIFSMNAVKNLIQNEYEIYGIFIIIVCVWGLMENILFVPSVNIPVLFIGVGIKEHVHKRLENGDENINCVDRI